MKIRQARKADIAAIHSLIAHYAGEGLLLPRDESDIRKHLDGFLVLTDGCEIIGCVGLESYHSRLAEIRSLAISPHTRGRGFGTRLVRGAVDLAESRSVARVFALTSAPEFFLRQGFQLSSRHGLHEKIDRDCIHCSKSSTCHLSAVIVDLAPNWTALNILEDSARLVPAE
jgi:N-acetylglutamate synthase-like GNAT family acetyltransferase